MNIVLRRTNDSVINIVSNCFVAQMLTQLLLFFPCGTVYRQNNIPSTKNILVPPAHSPENENKPWNMIRDSKSSTSSFDLITFLRRSQISPTAWSISSAPNIESVAFVYLIKIAAFVNFTRNPKLNIYSIRYSAAPHKIFFQFFSVLFLCLLQPELYLCTPIKVDYTSDYYIGEL